MALNVTSPPWQQTNMPALDLRRFLSFARTEGVASSSDMTVAQRGAGANMSVDISTGEALVQGDAITNQGRYYVYNDATFNLTGFSAANATLPRIDRVTLRVRDAFHGDAANDVSFQIVTGTPTSGATLANLNGATAVPNSQLLLANILVPATSTSITTTNIDATVRGLAVFGGQVALTSLQATGTTLGQQIVSNGTNWVAGGINYATTLPATPVNGLEAILVDSTTNPTYQWRFRWNSSSANADKWEYVGGTSTLVEVAAAVATSSTTYAALAASAGPSFTLPRAGVYEVAIGFSITARAAGTEGFMSYDIGATPAVDADMVRSGDFSGTSSMSSVARAMAKTGLTAVTLTSKYKNSAGTSMTYANRWMRVTPIRVS